MSLWIKHKSGLNIWFGFSSRVCGAKHWGFFSPFFFLLVCFSVSVFLQIQQHLSTICMKKKKTRRKRTRLRVWLGLCSAALFETSYLSSQWLPVSITSSPQTHTHTHTHTCMCVYSGELRQLSPDANTKCTLLTSLFKSSWIDPASRVIVNVL